MSFLATASGQNISRRNRTPLNFSVTYDYFTEKMSDLSLGDVEEVGYEDGKVDDTPNFNESITYRGEVCIWRPCLIEHTSSGNLD